ncbi:MAG: deoxyribose-phosphate aldolase [Gemmatimonadota bacterium]
MNRNRGVALDLDWIAETSTDRNALERRAGLIAARQPQGESTRVDGYLRAIHCIDLTSLEGDDTPGRIRRLCARARTPVRPEILAALGAAEVPVRTASVCVFPRFIDVALRALEGSGVPVCTVAAGFPHGLSPFEQRVQEIEATVRSGASEIDAVITRSLVLTGDWQTLYDEVRAFREASGPARLKTILATGELRTLSNVSRASLVCMMAGADFIKTSTGKESVNATFPAGLAMIRAIREFRDRTGYEVGFKPAGGIRTAEAALAWLSLTRVELGDSWTLPDRFRFGASSLVRDLARQLEHLATVSGAIETERSPA